MNALYYTMHVLIMNYRCYPKRRCYQYSFSVSGLTSDRCLKMFSLPATAKIVTRDCLLSNSVDHFIILCHYHKACWSILLCSRTCSKLRRNDSFRAHFLGDSTFNRLKCQVSSFCPAVCLLSFTERTICLGLCLQDLLSVFSSNQICGPVPRVMMYGKCCVHLKQDLFSFG